MVGSFLHLYITANLDLYIRVKYTEYILSGSALKKYCTVFLECKELGRSYSGYQWTLRAFKEVIMENFYTWAKTDGLESESDTISGEDRFEEFWKELWFELGTYMWGNHQSAFQYHVKYIHNGIDKPFSVIILHYYDHLC